MFSPENKRWVEENTKEDYKKRLGLDMGSVRT